MAEAGEVGHWAIVAKLNERAVDGSLKLAAATDPHEEE